MKISAIAIISKNRGLGFENHLLFHIPGELPRLKAITMGHPVVMGRKTHESIGRILPGRLNIVITRKGGEDVPGLLIFVDSLEKALEIAKESEGKKVKKSSSSKQSESRSELSTSSNKNKIAASVAKGEPPRNDNEGEIFILGGGQIFAESLSITDRLYLTIVDTEVPADTFFPDYEKEFTKVITEEKKTDWEYPYTFLTLEK
ncbi:MAG TPA: dihydrofolate reductase [Patescibacteria group bacterium]|nr:dihydrofolate reductase [Patescibacteria group bacterium]